MPAHAMSNDVDWKSKSPRPDWWTKQIGFYGEGAHGNAQTETTVGIGAHAFEKVPTGLHETAIFPGEAGLLGNALLSCFSTVTIDGKAGRVILGPRRPAQ